MIVPVNEQALHDDMSVVLFLSLAFAVFMAMRALLKERKTDVWKKWNQ